MYDRVDGNDFRSMRVEGLERPAFQTVRNLLEPKGPMAVPMVALPEKQARRTKKDKPFS